MRAGQSYLTGMESIQQGTQKRAASSLCNSVQTSAMLSALGDVVQALTRQRHMQGLFLTFRFLQNVPPHGFAPRGRSAAPISCAPPPCDLVGGSALHAPGCLLTWSRAPDKATSQPCSSQTGHTSSVWTWSASLTCSFLEGRVRHTHMRTRVWGWREIFQLVGSLLKCLKRLTVKPGF